MKIFAVTLFFAFYSAFSQSEINYKGEIINRLDENNRKTGVWKIYDDKNELLITTHFENGNYTSNTEYYKKSVLIASYDNQEYLYIYKNNDTIRARFKREESGRLTIVDDNGTEFNDEIRNFYFPNSSSMPMPYEGIEVVYKSIRQNISPRIKDSGKVIVAFWVDVEGFITETEIVSSTNRALNDEALRLVKILPRWQPGHQRGVFVKTKYKIPIVFQ